MTWNIGALSEARGSLEAVLLEHEPDVICLQHSSTLNARLVELLSCQGYGMERSTGGEGLLTIASRQPFSRVEGDVIPDLPPGAGIMSAVIAGIRLYNVILPTVGQPTEPAFAGKLQACHAVGKLLGQRHGEEDAFILAGSMMIAPLPDDVWSIETMMGQVSYHPLEHKEWAELLAQGLHDGVKPYLPSRTFTAWASGDENSSERRGMRLDHFLVSGSVVERVGDGAVQQVLEGKDGHHDPVLMTLDLFY